MDLHPRGQSHGRIVIADQNEPRTGRARLDPLGQIAQHGKPLLLTDIAQNREHRRRIGRNRQSLDRIAQGMGPQADTARQIGPDCGNLIGTVL